MATNSSGTINQSGKQNLGHGYFSTTSTFVNHIYNLTISFPDTGKDQSIDNAKSFAGHVTIEEGKQVNTTTFANDSWNTIAAAVKNGQLDAYPLGSEKEVEIGGTNYTVRVANNTTPNECSGTDFSQTACGFVVEFVDVLENRQMNSTSTSVGGWRDSAMRTYANGDFYNSLPEELRKVIKETKAVSGHGRTSGETNFISLDKIYLLSAHEVWEDGTSNQVLKYDTAWDKTRQLDYYAENGVTTSNYLGAIKKDINENASYWWLRATYSRSINYFHIFRTNGGWANSGATNSYGFAPAFRIG